MMPGSQHKAPISGGSSVPGIINVIIEICKMYNEIQKDFTLNSKYVIL